ncbi:beta-glucosidase [Sphingobium sp. AP50]|uniref:glycoside hydrolase family 3 N-terminal domain-containing protein n=1 Tax=Sphingobium sp. AP50 TaxID=1884369 RepID=UPI0008B3099E|nr:glycoside hydrolase family 3 N-terminal domain-containing protein [Sphingobium sp. AP50]SEJ93120.1 beta-glucosidase [Sphingobium sp. AP50]
MAGSMIMAVPALARPATLPYRDATLPVADRVRDLLSRMTLEEKAAQMRCIWFGKAGFTDATGAFSPDKAMRSLANGIGQIARPSDTAGTPRFKTEHFRTLNDSIAFINAVQTFLVERTRLGIPALFHEETAHGLAVPGATVFPSPPALGSSWDPTLVEQIFTVVGREARLRGATVALAPVIDLARDPRYGRVEEMFGEDPFHVGQMGLAAVRGQQGRSRPLGRDRVFATLKHFLHASPQAGINLSPADMHERGLRESFLRPFEMVIRQADPAIVMPSYNEVLGIPAHVNTPLLQGEGRKRMGFKGAYFSDYNGVTNLVDHHHVAADNDDAAVQAIEAGIDAELPDGQAYARLPQLVRDGCVAEALVDAAVVRILTLKFEAGLFERPYTDLRTAQRGINRPDDIALARLAARKAAVLLKNDGLLPLDPRKQRTIAVIGPVAEPALFGGYSGENDRAVGLLAGIRAAVGPDVRVEYAPGVRIVAPLKPGERENMAPIRPADAQDNRRLIAEAAALAKGADLVILAIGDVPQVTREAIFVDGSGDRTRLGLFGDQDALVDAVLAADKPVVGVLLNGRPLAVARLADGANALIEGWYLGQEGGHGLADILFGLANPGGKLAIGLPRTPESAPAPYDRHQSATIHRAIEVDRAPLFPFGFGLSYTRFQLSPPRLSQARIAPGQGVTVEVDVANVGERTGDEVVQIYLRDEVSSAPRPLLELKAFERVTVAPGERRTLRFPLDADAFAFWDRAMQWRVEPGRFTLFAGNSSAELQGVSLEIVAG